MQIIRESSALTAALASWRATGETLALVPTMGALHDGHLALIAEAKGAAQRVLATIFVNPMQFNDSADLIRYPRSEESDLARLRGAGCDAVWVPAVTDIYPDGFATRVSVANLSERWEGTHRPGHFDGVATVVAKLLIAVRPDLAIFGEKDWQQLAVIRRLERDLMIGVRIVGAATVRDDDGLALSSRNAFLDADARRRALALPQALEAARAAIVAGGAVQPALDLAAARLREACFSAIDYVALVDAATLEPLAEPRGEMRLIAAATLGTTRLIDNMRVVMDTAIRTASPPR